MKWSLITASNNEEVLRRCLARSPCLKRAADFNAMRGFPSAAAAYNAGMRLAAGEVLVFAHQDVYLPQDWDGGLEQAIHKLEAGGVNWAVLGVWGLRKDGAPCGHVFCNSAGRVLGAPFLQPVECSTLDEVVLVLRRSTGLCFDENLAGFDLYGTDICLTAAQKGFTNYIVPAFCVHNPPTGFFNRLSFWRWYFFMRRKWWQALPIKTPSTVISRWPVRFPGHFIYGAYKRYIKRVPRRAPAEDVEELYRTAACGPGPTGPLGQK